MAKIGILTFHIAHNYGAQLQCFALQEYLKIMGHEVEIVDYRPQWLQKKSRWFVSSRLKCRNPINLLKELLRLPKRRAKARHYEDFISSNLQLSDGVDTAKYDLVFVGSDQVWSLKLTRGYDPYYWGDKPGSFASYAVSMGGVDFSEIELDLIKDKLKNFNYISLRERVSIDIIQKLTDKEVFHVLDPTLLLDSKVYDQIVVPERKMKPYLLFYDVMNLPAQKIYVKELAEKMNLELKIMSSFVQNCNDSYCAMAGPGEFLSLFRGASFIVSASFHGTIFSLIYKRPFCAIKSNLPTDVRVVSLLEGLGLEEKAIFAGEQVSVDAIDWADVDRRLEQQRVCSKEYLDTVLRDIHQAKAD